MKFHPHLYVVNLIITNESLGMESGEYISCPQRESVDRVLTVQTSYLVLKEMSVTNFGLVI